MPQFGRSQASGLSALSLGKEGGLVSLGGAFEDVLRFYRAGRLPLHAAVTDVVDGLEGIQRELEAGASFESRHAKVLAQLGEGKARSRLIAFGIEK